jgi:hypothetical protein
LSFCQGISGEVEDSISEAENTHEHWKRKDQKLKTLETQGLRAKDDRIRERGER